MSPLYGRRGHAEHHWGTNWKDQAQVALRILPNSVYQPFNFKSEDINLTSPWLRGLYTDEIKKIRDRTQCPELQRYLLLLTTRPEKTWAWTDI